MLRRMCRARYRHATPPSDHSSQKRTHADHYLQSPIFVIRYNRTGGFVVLHPHSAVVLPTDTLGAHAARLLLLGYGAAAIGATLEQRCPGTGRRWGRLVAALLERGALGRQAPRRTMAWWMRRVPALALGPCLSVLNRVLRLLPVWALHQLFEASPATPLGKRTRAHLRPLIEANLCAAGYADRSHAWRRGIAQEVAAATIRTRFMSFLILTLPRARLRRFIQRVTAIQGLEHLAQAATDHEGAIVVGLHWELFLAPVFYASQLRPISLLANVSLADYSVASAQTLAAIPLVHPVDFGSRMAAKTLADRLRRGHIVMLAFDVAAATGADAAQMHTLSFLGHTLPRFATAAWLSVRCGKPILLVSTHREGNRLVVELSPPLVSAPALPPKEQIARLTEQIYTAGEQLVRHSPESWLAWSYVQTLVAPSRERTDGASAGQGPEEPGGNLSLT